MFGSTEKVLRSKTCSLKKMWWVLHTSVGSDDMLHLLYTPFPTLFINIVHTPLSWRSKCELVSIWQEKFVGKRDAMKWVVHYAFLTFSNVRLLPDSIYWQELNISPKFRQTRSICEGTIKYYLRKKCWSRSLSVGMVLTSYLDGAWCFACMENDRNFEAVKWGKAADECAENQNGLVLGDSELQTPGHAKSRERVVEAFRSAVNIVPKDLPHSFCKEQNDDRWHHETFTIEYMIKLAVFRRDRLKCQGHRHDFSVEAKFCMFELVEEIRTGREGRKLSGGFMLMVVVEGCVRAGGDIVENYAGCWNYNSGTVQVQGGI